MGDGGGFKKPCYVMPRDVCGNNVKMEISNPFILLISKHLRSYTWGLTTTGDRILQTQNFEEKNLNPKCKGRDENVRPNGRRC